MKRTFIAATAIALLLALGAGSSVFAADDQNPDPPAVDVSAAPSGEISVDPTFITPGPVATPISEVMGATGRPVRRTMPPTDTIDGGPAQAPGSGLQLILLLAVGGSSLVLIAGRLPVARRR